ncbi:MAG: hypothetical protein P8J50_02455 [Acidimicrobiales bacterium]|nr:hypothetical protein [Acidimicrobiales bacterium]
MIALLFRCGRGALAIEPLLVVAQALPCLNSGPRFLLSAVSVIGLRRRDAWCRSPPEKYPDGETDESTHSYPKRHPTILVQPMPMALPSQDW